MAPVRASVRRRRTARARVLTAGVLGVVALTMGVSASSGQTSMAGLPAPPVMASTPYMSVDRIDYPVSDGVADPQQNYMDLYLPTATRPGRLPLVILIHGGAWKSRVGAASFTAFAVALADRDLAVLNIEYRRVGRGGGWPTTFSDIAAAMDTIPALAQRFPRIDPRRSVVIGHSAGAQLAVWSATRRRPLPGDPSGPPRYRPALAVSISGPLDLRRAVRLGDRNPITVLGGTAAQVPGHFAAVDPIQNIDPSVPIIAVVGSRDTTVPALLTYAYASAVHADGGHAEVVVLAGQTHSSIVRTTSATFPQLLDEIVDATTEVGTTHQGRPAGTAPPTGGR
ncbi:alpha/beta hydrolase [Gordonia sp. VNK1]|uniref:alpha/beta hydrolase n=1 Tax=Gordonia oleivorans TaxID=3156618 RepID=UPI0032B37CB3